MLILAIVCSLLAASGLWTVRGGILSGSYYSILAGLVTITILPPGQAVAPAWLQAAWKGLGLLWAFWGALVWLVGSYVHNLPGEFYASLAITVLLLVLCRRSFRLPLLAIQAVNTLILLLIATPVVDLTLRWLPHPAQRAEPRDELYLYRNAERNPAGYAQWCATFDAEWGRVVAEVFVSDPAGLLRPRPKPGSHTRFFDGNVSINSLGFRGKEVSREKGNAYRIVALGESTTFGYTLNEKDSPWPDLLEQFIRQRLRPQRPVEVINAGTPAWDLQANLGRLATEILPLHPDMIISYHGYNGFWMIQGVVPLSNLRAPPVYRPRPVKLLADCEYRLAVMNAVSREQALLAKRASSFVTPLQTAYARAYGQLIQVAQTNHIRLVLADFAMAVNENSPRRILDFYRRRFPAVVWWIKANQVHSMILRQLAQQHPEVLFVDTHPNLDGDNDKFVDLMHFTEAGRQQLAETMFAGIRDVLERDLAAPAHEN
jgi:lysophospholipase L1-like esterase